jgi:hypothetical protein
MSIRFGPKTGCDNGVVDAPAAGHPLCHFMGPILDTIIVSHGVAGASSEELGWHVNMCLLCPFTASVRAHRFANSVITPWGYKTGSRSCANLHPLTQPPISSSPPFLHLKRKRGT